MPTILSVIWFNPVVYVSKATTFVMCDKKSSSSDSFDIVTMCISGKLDCCFVFSGILTTGHTDFSYSLIWGMQSAFLSENNLLIFLTLVQRTAIEKLD